MTEYIDIELKRAATTLAATLNYFVAAKRLSLTPTELKRRITELEEKLCLHLFRPGLKVPQLTEEGRLLIHVFQEAIKQHDQRKEDRGESEGH